MRSKYFFLLILAFIVAETPLLAQEQDSEGTADASASAKPDKRIFGVLPNYRTTDASQPFAPITARQKLNIARRDSFDWPTYALAGALTLVTRDHSEQDHSTATRFAIRYARSSADQIVGNMLTEGFMPVLLRQDPRYFRPGTGSFGSRLGAALGQTIVARNDHGHKTFNASEFLGNAMAVGISNTYTPDLNSWSHRTQKLFLMISLDTLSNVTKEFGPDIRQKVFHHNKSS